MLSKFYSYIYKDSPHFMRQLISLIPFSLLYGKTYRSYLRYLEKSQNLSEEALKSIQLEQLRKVLSYAYENVPYYKRVFDDIGFNPKSLSTLSDIQHLPFLEKKDVFTNGPSLISMSIPKSRMYTGMTGGTTGSPIELVFDLNAHRIEYAYMHLLWKRVGYTPEQRKVTIMGVPFRGNKKVITKVNPLYRELLISPFHLNEDYFESIYKQILNFKPAFVHGLPSGVCILADYLLKSNKRVHGIKAVLCGSENITDQQRNLIEKAFSARLFTWYGQTEKVVLGGECEHDKGYHIFPEYGYTELIDENDKTIESPGVIGEIVGTGFINMAQPLIRYRTGDLGVYKGSRCVSCKRNYLVIEKVVGRRNFDVLIDKFGKIIPFVALDLQKKIFNKVYQWQFIQTTPGIVQVNVLTNEKISDVDLLDFARELGWQADERLYFKFAIVNELRKTALGKTKTIINELAESRQLADMEN